MWGFAPIARVDALERQLAETTEVARSCALLIDTMRMFCEAERAKTMLLSHALRTLMHGYGNGTTRQALFAQMQEQIEAFIKSRPMGANAQFIAEIRLAFAELKQRPEKGLSPFNIAEEQDS